MTTEPISSAWKTSYRRMETPIKPQSVPYRVHFSKICWTLIHKHDLRCNNARDYRQMMLTINVG